MSYNDRKNRNGRTSTRRIGNQDDHGKPDPAPLIDLDLEAEIIGAVLDDNSTLRDCGHLAPDHFSDPIHAELWERILWLRQQGRDATLSTLALDLGSRLEQIGGRDFLSTLAMRGLRLKSATADAAHRIRDLSQWRHLRALAADLVEWSERGDSDADSAISAAINEMKIALANGGSRARRKSDVARDAINLVIKGRDPDSTGIVPIDYLFHGGLMPCRSYAIAGLYGRGKTILLSSISENLNAQGVNHLFISHETPVEDTEIRHCARSLGLNAAQLYDKDDPLWTDFTDRAAQHVDQIQDHTFYEYAPGATIDEIERMIIRAIHLHGIRGVILDYWQMVEGKERGQTEQEHLKIVARRLANMARKENIWVLVAAQADENGEVRECRTGLHTAFTMVIRMVRGENDETAYFDMQKTNHTRYASTGDSSTPGVIFDFSGPHFRSAEPEDLASLQGEEA